MKTTQRLRARLDTGATTYVTTCTLRGFEARTILDRMFGVSYNMAGVDAPLHRHFGADPQVLTDFKEIVGPVHGVGREHPSKRIEVCCENEQCSGRKGTRTTVLA